MNPRQGTETIERLGRRGREIGQWGMNPRQGTETISLDPVPFVGLIRQWGMNPRQGTET